MVVSNRNLLFQGSIFQVVSGEGCFMHLWNSPTSWGFRCTATHSTDVNQIYAFLVPAIIVWSHTKNPPCFGGAGFFQRCSPHLWGLDLCKYQVYVQHSVPHTQKNIRLGFHPDTVSNTKNKTGNLSPTCFSLLIIIIILILPFLLGPIQPPPPSAAWPTPALLLVPPRSSDGAATGQWFRGTNGHELVSSVHKKWLLHVQEKIHNSRKQEKKNTHLISSM